MAGQDGAARPGPDPDPPSAAGPQKEKKRRPGWAALGEIHVSKESLDTQPGTHVSKESLDTRLGNPCIKGIL